MRNFYDDALSILTLVPKNFRSTLKLMQPEHFEAIRMLPSFRMLIKGLIETQEQGNVARAEALIDDDAVLLKEIEISLASREATINRLLRAMHVLTCSTGDSTDKVDLYITTFQGDLSHSDFVHRVLESIKRMTPEDFVGFLKDIRQAMEQGAPELNLVGWANEDPDFLEEINKIESEASTLLEESIESGDPVRSSYAIHSKGLRTTVIAQRVQLSYEKSALSKQDKQFTTLVDRLSKKLIDYFTLENPQDVFLNEVWLYDYVRPYRRGFTPRPRAAIEQALSAPYDYLTCKCCEPVEGLSSAHPTTAILYQMSLETGSLINICDLWSAFLELFGGEDGRDIDERDMLVLFYRALADLKLLGMVKQSKKKADHLAKVAWKGL